MKIRVIIISGVALLCIGALSGYFFTEITKNQQILIAEKTKSYETQKAYLISEQLTALPTRTPQPSSTPTITNTSIPPTPTMEPTHLGGGSGNLLMTYYHYDLLGQYTNQMDQFVSDLDGNILLERHSPDEVLNISPDGDKFVYPTENGIELATLEGDIKLFTSDIVNSRNGLIRLVWFPDSQRILVFIAPGVFIDSVYCNIPTYSAYVLDIVGQTLVFIGDNVVLCLSEANISPDGNWIILLRSDQIIYLVSTDGTNAKSLLSANDFELPFWSADGNSIFYVKQSHEYNVAGKLLEIDPNTSISKELITGGFSSANVVVSKISNKLYFAGSIVDLSTNPANYTVLPVPEQIPINSGIKITHLSPDENWMALNYMEFGTDEIFSVLYNLTTMESKMFNYEIPEYPSPWSPDSKQLIVFEKGNPKPLFYDVINDEIIGEIKQPTVDMWGYFSWIP